jgi:hypothetical protein
MKTNNRFLLDVTVRRLGLCPGESETECVLFCRFLHQGSKQTVFWGGLRSQSTTKPLTSTVIPMPIYGNTVIGPPNGQRICRNFGLATKVRSCSPHILPSWEQWARPDAAILDRQDSIPPPSVDYSLGERPLKTYQSSPTRKRGVAHSLACASGRS